MKKELFLLAIVVIVFIICGGEAIAEDDFSLPPYEIKIVSNDDTSPQEIYEYFGRPVKKPLAAKVTLYGEAVEGINVDFESVFGMFQLDKNLKRATNENGIAGMRHIVGTGSDSYSVKAYIVGMDDKCVYFNIHPKEVEKKIPNYSADDKKELPGSALPKLLKIQVKDFPNETFICEVVDKDGYKIEDAEEDFGYPLPRLGSTDNNGWAQVAFVISKKANPGAFIRLRIIFPFLRTYDGSEVSHTFIISVEDPKNRKETYAKIVSGNGQLGGSSKKLSHELKIEVKNFPKEQDEITVLLN